MRKRIFGGIVLLASLSLVPAAAQEQPRTLELGRVIDEVLAARAA